MITRDEAGVQLIVSTFETDFPHEIAKVDSDHDPYPPRTPAPAWHKDGYEYHAYLPKDRQAALNYHVFRCLTHVQTVQRDGRYWLGEETGRSWVLLEQNLSHSIRCASPGVLTSLEDCEPPLAEKYGYMRGHKTLKGLRHCLMMSRNAFLFRWAYFLYILSLRGGSGETIDIPPWIFRISDSTHYAWVDSLWDALRQQKMNSNFIGTVLTPDVPSVRWIAAASSIGVPVWVSWRRGPDDYHKLDGSRHVKNWCPSAAQVHAARSRPPPTLVPVDAANPAPPTGPSDIPPAHTPSAPEIPRGGAFILSWEEFFRLRDEADQAAQIVATPAQRQQWESRTRNARSYSEPGKNGPRVYTWSKVESGGYIRELVDRGDVGSIWESYRRREMVFNARANIWDLGEMFSSTVKGNDDELDELDDAEDALWEDFDTRFLEPQAPALPPGEDTSDLAFLYRRYGFLSVEPTTTPPDVLQTARSNIRRAVGLTPEGLDAGVTYIKQFVTRILQGQLPDGHCDLTPDSPDNERFPLSAWGTVDRILEVVVPDLGDTVVYAYTPRDDRNKILIHDILTVIELGRMKVQTNRASIIDYLLRSGSRFTVLSERTEQVDTTDVHVLTSPTRPEHWKGDADDYRAYMSRLGTFFAQRPRVAAAALAQGGIAWRLAVEVLGLDIDLVLNGAVFTGESSAIAVANFPQWCHDVDEGEWFFLVGGYDILTGSFRLFHTQSFANANTGNGLQTRDISWWPKINVWNGCGLDLGCWTPQCEQWFQRRLERILSGTERPQGTSRWKKNLRYEKETRKFVGQFRNLGRHFLAHNYPTLLVQ